MSALRPVEPIDTRGLEAHVPDTGLPIFEWLDPRSLFVDPAYQRNLGEKSLTQIRRIVERFDWTRFRPPVCAFSQGADGESVLMVIDGQHTAIAAASNPHVVTIPVMIVEAADQKTQAAAFIGQNLDRLGITKTQMHVAALTAGDEDALALEEVCSSAGVRILRGPPSGGVGYKVGDTVSVAAIGTLLKAEGRDHTAMVLKLLVVAESAPLIADQIKAMNALLIDPQYGSVDLEELAPGIRTYGLAALKDAKVFSSTHSVPTWKGLASVWFQKAKKRRGAAQSRSSHSDEGSKSVTVADLPDDLSRDPRPARGAWAPGNQVIRCRECDYRFRGGPAAKECASCAYGGDDASNL